MRGLNLGPGVKIPAGTVLRLLYNPPGGVLCPKLEWLSWDVQASNVLSLPLFLSPHLKCVNLYKYVVLEAQLAYLSQFISSLPTSLEDLCIMCGNGKEETLKDAVSAFICRCGSSLRTIHLDRKSHV